jgi:hypothetical protein
VYSAEGGEAERLKELTGILEQAGISFEERPLVEYGGGGSSLFVRLPGADSGGDGQASFILAVPLSLPGDLDSGLPFRLETALCFIRKNRADPPPVSMMTVFLGREPLPGAKDKTGGDAADYPGLEDLAVFLEEPENAPLIYLGLDKPPEKIQIYHGSAGYISPLNLLRPFTDMLAKRHIPYSLRHRYAGLYRFRLARGSAALGFIQSRGMSALALASAAGGSAGQSPLDAETLGELLADYSANLNFSFEQAETRYAVFVSGQGTRYLSEKAAVLLVLFLGGLCLALFLGYSVFHRRRIRLLWGRGLAFFWVGPLIFGILALCCLGAGLLLTKILSASTASLSGVRSGGALLIMLTGGLLFSLAVLPLNSLPVKGKAGLYGNSAFFMTALGLTGGIFFDISLSPALLWMLFCVFLGSSLKQASWVLLCALLSLFTPLSVLADSAGTSRFMALFQSEYRLFFLSFIALFLPFYLLTIRAVLLYRRRRRRYPPWQRRIISRLVLLALALSGLFLYSGRLSAGADNGGQVTVTG